MITAELSRSSSTVSYKVKLSPRIFLFGNKCQTGMLQMWSYQDVRSFRLMLWIWSFVISRCLRSQIDAAYLWSQQCITIHSFWSWCCRYEYIKMFPASGSCCGYGHIKMFAASGSCCIYVYGHIKMFATTNCIMKIK